MNWRAFLQRIAFLAFVAILVLVLIKMGLDTNLALAIAGGIVLTAKDLWLSAGVAYNAPVAAAAPVSPSSEHSLARGVSVRQLAVSSEELREPRESMGEDERGRRNGEEGA